MVHLPQTCHRLVTDPLRGTVRGDPLRMLLFECPQLFEQPVVFSIRDLRRRQDVVEVIVPPDFVAEVRKLVTSVHRAPGSRPHSGTTVTCWLAAALGIRHSIRSVVCPVLRN